MGVTTKKIFLTILIIFLFSFLINPRTVQTAEKTSLEVKKEIEALTKEIEAKKNRISSLEQKIKNYENNIKAKQEQSNSLKNQISILDNKIWSTEAKIDQTGEEIDKLNLELQYVTLEILDKEELIKNGKSNLAELIRNTQQSNRVKPLEILFTANSLSNFYKQVKYLEKVQTIIHNNIVQIKNDKAMVVNKKTELQEKENNLRLLVKNLEQEKGQLNDSSEYKSNLLRQTKSSETYYQRLLRQSKSEYESSNADIANLEKEVRKKLEEKEKITSVSPVSFIWPVDPARGLSALFHDPGYTFKSVFEHPAVDIIAAQGKPIKATADGYVARTNTGGRSGYGYIMIVHNGGFSSVYGHPSAIYVKEEQFVKQGEVIGAVGGKPGTPGAGPFTTGSHLHFEIRKDGIPTNPLNYLQ